MAPEFAQTIHERVTGEIEPLVDVLEALGRDRLDADQRAANVRAPHRLQEFLILGGFHRDLRVENQVVGQRGQPLHQVEPLLADRLELVKARVIGAPPRRREIALADRIEVVVGERDEPEAQPAQVDDLVDDRVHVRARGRWPSVRHTEQNEQCFGQPRTV